MVQKRKRISITVVSSAVALLLSYGCCIYTISTSIVTIEAFAPIQTTISIAPRHADAASSSERSEQNTVFLRRNTVLLRVNFQEGNSNSNSKSENDSDSDSDSEFCVIGENVVDECSSTPPNFGTESSTSAATNLAKCICGAGSFALPHVFLEEGVLGGTLALTACGSLATLTMHSLADSKQKASEFILLGNDNNGNNIDTDSQPVTSYVQLARVALGESAAKVVFALTLSASIGVCSTYLVFIGSTLESMSNDIETMNVVRQYLPDISKSSFELAAAAILFPLSCIRDYSVFAFTSALGVFAVVGGILVTLAYGILVDPGGGLSVAVESIETLPMWPTSLSSAFGGSFGTICYLFAINFLTFPVINSMKTPSEYNGAVSKAVAGVWVVNVIFSILALGFYREQTQDLVLANLDNGPYLSALKLLLCVDLLFTFPIVFSSGRQILENAILGPEEASRDESQLARVAIVAGAVTGCYGLAQLGGFGAVANLVGGVAQGTLAFIMPPAIAIAISKKSGREEEMEGIEKVGQYAVATFGVSVVSAVTYFTFTGIGMN